MKKFRKGFTLVELLIVVAVIGVLAAMMTMSSTDAVDSAGANTILGNLGSLKTAAIQMYTDYPTAAALTAVKLDGKDKVGDAETDTVAKVLAGYLGKATAKIGVTATSDAKYGLVGNSSCWYVVYKLDASDGAGLRAKLAGKASAAGLYGTDKLPAPTTETGNEEKDQDDCGFTTATPYDGTEKTSPYYVGIKVF